MLNVKQTRSISEETEPKCAMKEFLKPYTKQPYTMNTTQVNGSTLEHELQQSPRIHIR